MKAEVFDILQDEHRYFGSALGFDLAKIGAFHVVEDKSRPRIVFNKTDIDSAHLQTFHVAHEEAISRYDAEHARLRIGIVALRGFGGGILFRSPAAVDEADVVQVNILDL